MGSGADTQDVRRTPGIRSERGDDIIRNVTGDVTCYDGKKADADIDHPDHYNQGNIEVIDFIEDQAHLGFCRQISLKYICRSGKKDGQSKETDLRKAIYYLEREMGMHRKC